MNLDACVSLASSVCTIDTLGVIGAFISVKGRHVCKPKLIVK